MLPTNVMSFMKKMVTTNEGAPSSSDPGSESGTALSKLRQTLSSSLMTAQDKVTKLSPARQSAAPEPASTPTDDKTNQPKAEDSNANKKSEPAKPPCRTGACRVCLKSFKPNDFFRTCFECQQKVCEDCASYSKLDENQDESTWRCSICRRKMQSRAQPVIQQDSTDSLLDVPMLEALQRRHSDVKINAANAGSGGGGGGLGAGLAPPRTPELRRHSDVSPASLKELEKVAGERREELRWEREMEWRQHGKSGPPRPGGAAGSPGTSRVGSPQVERRPFGGEERNWDPRLKPEDSDHNGRGRASPGTKPPTVSIATDDADAEGEAWRRRQGRTRRMSRVTRQHSYDEELKNASGGGGPGGGGSGGDTGLGLPVQLPRRASAYDVYAARSGDPSSGGLNPAAVAAAVASVSRQQQQQQGGQQTQTPSVRYGSNGDAGESGEGPSPTGIPTSRRPSFRAGKPPGIYDFDNTDSPDQSVFDTSSSPLSPEAAAVAPSGLGVDEDRRTRRRGSQLPDLSAIQARVPAARPSAVPPRAMEDLCGGETVRRQASVTDGEAIKIVIHDVDSDASFSTRPGSKRRVVLRRDPSDKAHRSEYIPPHQLLARGFGMRVVGGKTGNDGRLFAYIVWTVPGGPAEKGGLQQGDKVLEWDGVSLVDRSFEEVCAVMDRTGDVAELLVEHGTDLRMCDLLDDPSALVSGPRKSQQGESLGMQLESEQEKTPTSPTRRKLPKTPEQLAREKTVSGRIQLQVFYHDEKHELVVSVLAADDLAPREDTGYGSLPEAYVKLRLMPVTGDQCCAKSDVAEPTQNPIWNATFDFPNVPGEELMERTIEVTLWDYCPDRESIFLGESTVDLQKAFLEDRPVWYRLEDPRQLRSGGKSPHSSPRGSLASEIAQRLLRRAEFGQQRSFSDDKESDDKASSPEFNFLHPDHAWLALGSASGSRRGSSQSEQLEVETYQLGRDFSRSLPGSRRSSFQSAQNASLEKDPEMPPPSYNKERRRSSCSRSTRDPDEILRNLKAVKGELMLGRTLSLSGEKRTHRRHKDRRESMLDLPEKQGIGCSSPSDDEDKTGGTAPTDAILDDDDVKLLPEVTLGPGQIHPRGYRLTTGHYGEIKLGLLMTKGQLEVEVVCARNIACEARESMPDTYVKTYLRDGDRWLQKRKTRVVRHSNDPQYRQTLRYSACDVLGRSLLVMLWERQKGFEHNQGLGGAEVALDKIQLTHLTTGWYPLFPIHSLGSDSNDSP
ncbi:regulating synaptic membrane exocytosis protein 1 [Periplaneta americana]|uniref:regulating synaptic membrane exocytosis protein 1 n=1 Tax=Periplaneta americana TaxID=6978 RepID=UPI0037E8DBDA